ncbi:MAG: S8 family serine peptidase [Bacteroidales bacterium]|nr:S8 family serine peptidase [Bacteroidales bacterium]
MKHPDSISLLKTVFRKLFVVLLIMSGCLSVFAHANSHQYEVNTIDAHKTHQFREGEMIVKFKSESGVQLRSAKNGNIAAENVAVEKALAALGATESEALMPLTGANVHPRAVALRSASGKMVTDSDLSQMYLLRFDESKMDMHRALEKLEALDEVEFAEPNYIVHTLAAEGSAVTDCDYYEKEPLYGKQWGHGQLKLPFLWKQKVITDKRPVIAILDTGVDIEHPDLKDNIWTNKAESEGMEGEDDDANGYADDIHGYDFVNKTARLGDWNGHGTHCAGIAAAVGKNGKGITGANPDALIMPVTVMQSNGTGDVATIIKGIDYAAANGADVISMSIGGYGYSLAEEMALAKAYSKAVLVAAAGNDCLVIGPKNSPSGICGICDKPAAAMFPAAFTFVLGVEASTPDGYLASFSNHDPDGPVFSYYDEEKLYNYELRAPGASIMSTYPGGRYKELSGTSMACPYVAGAVSRLLQCKEYSSWEVLFGDLIHARKKHANQLVDFEAAYKITDADRKPTLSMVAYALKDTIEGDADGKADAGEIIAFYPTLRNDWGLANNIKITLEMGENEDPEIIKILDQEVDFGKTLNSYGKNKSTNPIRIKVNDNCADGRIIRLVLRATCDDIAEELKKEFTLTAENGVEIGGMITEDMTLYPNVHYIVTKPIAVPEGVTLSIMPGTVLKFRDNTGLLVAGNIYCHGKPDSMIVFTSADMVSAGNIWDTDDFDFGESYISYVHFDNMEAVIKTAKASHCLLTNNYGRTALNEGGEWTNSNFFYNTTLYSVLRSGHEKCNIISNIILEGGRDSDNSMDIQSKGSYESNVFGNISSNTWGYLGDYNFVVKNNESPAIESLHGSYLGTTNEQQARNGILDMYHSSYPMGFSMFDFKTASSSPSAEAHGIVWKIVVNGYDAQDEFNMLPPLGVGKHKFEVYFNRPMDTIVAPMLAMGVRPPYTSHSIAEEGSWRADSLVYTAYLTITGKTSSDGLNRIYVAGAEDNEHFEIPVENLRFHVEVAAAGSMATGLMAEAGLGKVSLTWQTDEEDFEDLLGYNIYRYTMDEVGQSSDSIIINPMLIASEDSSYVDYDVVPGTTYYYVIKQLTTSLNSHALSNAVAATPLTAQKGDANGSMNVDIADVVTEVAYITFQNPQPFIFEAADVNEDTKVNVLDVVGTVGIITNPAQNAVNSLDEEAVLYYVQDGVLYMENKQYLGGVQLRLNAAMGTEINVLESLADMEQTSVWTSDTEYLFLAYSMSGRSIAPGKHALLKIGESSIREMVVSDVKGHNVVTICKTVTGIGKVRLMQMQQPSPNAFSDYLNVPYVIGKTGWHEVRIVFCDLAGRCIDVYSSVDTMGEYVYTWRPKNLQDGMYLLNFYVDGVLMQTAKVMCKH